MSETLRVLVAGGSGFIGTELIRQLTDDGHQVTLLVRGEPQSDNQATWAPASGTLDPGLISDTDAVINLSGASIGKLPWTHKYRDEILKSRLDATRTLTDAMARAATPPATFLSGSAVGIYGDRPGEILTEESPRGKGFLGDVVEQWERAASLSPTATRVVMLRTGLVIGDGGSLKPIMALTRVGLGSRLASGTDVWPWISLYDEAAAIRYLLTSTLSGPVNLAGPTRATSGEITKYVAHKMHRPYALAVPEFAIDLALQDAGEELLLSSQNVSSEKLTADGFVFRDHTVEQAIDEFL
ncbi:TIGR01777 family oxidoreductase [Lacisediminihabitans changchengi]|uniref:TIGR01777 family oxidoreductase n=1 Tax=Lacisediminihabitans changchengi TaxID=2787634 RepID=A0A934W367_9MICO|nr:TIGR01777 family oxidoreductase [Lacisediminihabitans changchengi]MBK4347596.1 TIGR01777 family oxidoreductase [Lacisediminihabitans changchengi]